MQSEMLHSQYPDQLHGMDKRNFNRLQKKISAWLAHNVTNAMAQEFSFNEPTNILRKFSEGDDGEIALVGMSADDLSYWNLIQYENSLINHGLIDQEKLACSSKYAAALIDINTRLIDNHFSKKIDCGILLENAALALALQIISGWQNESRTTYGQLVAGLDSSLLDLRKNPRHSAGELYRHFWFMIQLSATVYGQKIETANYSYPDSMAPYDAVLANWDSKDMGKVGMFVSAMSDFHLEQARFTAHDEIHEFDIENCMLFPYEILAYLRMREWAGLDNPETYQHLLMNNPLATLPPPLPVPESPLLDAVNARLQKIFKE